MAIQKYASAGAQKKGLSGFTAACTRVTAISGLSATPVLTDITATYKLATTSMTAGTDQPLTAGSGDSWIATMAAKSGVSITATGTATMIAIDDGTDFLITTCISQALTSSGTVTIPSWTQTAGPTA